MRGLAARLTGSGKAFQIFRHQAVLAQPVITQDIPAKQACIMAIVKDKANGIIACLLYTSPSPRDS